MRLKSELWVQAYIRGVQNEGGGAMLVRRGETTAGAIYIRVNLLDGQSYIFSPAPSYLTENIDVRHWYLEHGPEPLPDRDVDQFLNTQISYDTDIWIIEVEDREGRHFLGDQLAEISV